MKRIRVFIKKLHRNKRGFTFVECIVAVALLAIIGTLAFSLFSNASRYMVKARQEETKQNAAESMALQDTYMNDEGDYIIYSSDVLVVSRIENPDYDSNNASSIRYFANYSARLTYTTEYGNVTIEIPLKLSPDKYDEQPGSGKVNPYKRYMVLTDGLNGEGLLTGRKIYIYDTLQENGILYSSDVYED